MDTRIAVQLPFDRSSAGLGIEESSFPRFLEVRIMDEPCRSLAEMLREEGVFLKFLEVFFGNGNAQKPVTGLVNRVLVRCRARLLVSLFLYFILMLLLS